MRMDWEYWATSSFTSDIGPVEHQIYLLVSVDLSGIPRIYPPPRMPVTTRIIDMFSRESRKKTYWAGSHTQGIPGLLAKVFLLIVARSSWSPNDGFNRDHWWTMCACCNWWTGLLQINVILNMQATLGQASWGTPGKNMQTSWVLSWSTFEFEKWRWIELHWTFHIILTGWQRTFSLMTVV